VETLDGLMLGYWGIEQDVLGLTRLHGAIPCSLGLSRNTFRVRNCKAAEARMAKISLRPMRKRIGCSKVSGDNLTCHFERADI
jgi:hypothetical protein